MKKINNIVKVLIIVFLMISICNIVFALDMSEDKLKKYKGTLTEDTTIITKGSKIIGAFQTIGSIVSIIALVVIGIKYMMSSVEEKAINKETFIFYVIGAVLVFGISNISQMIYDWATKL